MRKFYTNLLLPVICLLIIAGCKKEDSDYWMRAKTGTEYFNVTNCSGIALGGQLAIHGYSYRSGAIAAPMIDITIRNWSGATGTYYIGATPVADSASASYEHISGTARSGMAGTVEITSVTAVEVRGIFSFTCADSTAVTNGSFKAKKL